MKQIDIEEWSSSIVSIDEVERNQIAMNVEYVGKCNVDAIQAVFLASGNEFKLCVPYRINIQLASPTIGTRITPKFDGIYFSDHISTQNKDGSPINLDIWEEPTKYLILERDTTSS